MGNTGYVGAPEDQRGVYSEETEAEEDEHCEHGVPASGHCEACEVAAYVDACAVVETAAPVVDEVGVSR